jgi:asparagine synthase (glutamine-hydrolysing)
MCGIAGAVNWGDRATLAGMARVQAHRGPDDEGLWELVTPGGDWIGLVSRRLAIQDLSSAGHMPMSTPDGRLTLTYNGEIYNYPTLRRELESKGYHFRSNSDTEAILYLYQEYGPSCVEQLNGIFALALWDRDQQQLFLARDHFGVKPLYYCHEGARFACASEVKALLGLPGMRRELDPCALQQYLSFLWTPDPLTMFAGIFKLPAGHYAIYRAGIFEVTQYWDLPFPPAEHVYQYDERALIVELRERLFASVKAQLLSDVPVGAFLSSGLDSSSIVAAMVAQTDRPVRTFTIAFPDRYRKGELTLDDTVVARHTARHFGCHHTEIVVQPDVAELLPKLVWYMDEPTADPAVIMTYLLNREARKESTVLLSGVGGDELFAGYRKHRAHYLAAGYQHIPATLRTKIIAPLVESLPSFRSTPVKGYVRLAKKMARSGSLAPVERFITDSVYLSHAQQVQLCTSETVAWMNGSAPWYQHERYFDAVAGADFLNQMLYVDTKTFLVSLNLTYNDKMSMASSVEVRVPFLAPDLAEWVAWNVPPSLKLHGNTGKYLLREAMRPLLPPEVLRQRKAGFGAPIDVWLAHDLRGMVDDVLNDTTLRRRGLFRPEAVRQMIADQRSGRQDWSLQIWQLLTLELWMQAFID